MDIHFENASPDSFKLRKLLGKGSFGKVYQVIKLHGKDEDKTYAMKVVKKSGLICRSKTENGKQKIIKTAISEKDILLSIEHPFIIKLFYAFQTDKKIYLILEQASRYNLGKLLETVISLPESSTLFYINQVVLAVEYLHSKGIMHRDIKPDNILIDAQGYIKLADFGLSKNNFKNGRTYSNSGTCQFMAPEMFGGVGYGKEVDWWAVGILLCRMLTGSFPQFVPCGKSRQAKFFGYLNPTARKLLMMLLNDNVKERLGTRGSQEIKQQLYFKNTNWEKVLKRLENPPFVPKNKDESVVSRFCKKLFSRPIRDSTGGSIDGKYNDPFKGFTFIGDIENAE